ncbi:protein-glutamate O-methyltransferase CheR [Komagataeibacter melaceti]|uniref:protein-glutamate O-methyltransferase n=1 Tax=Komagataeibacter melaceti TaxID=2766577 RepID=A0A371Z1I4_9PROT|nr:protein-glutamate O-methyltransferase CheR [Komagataeibacter melaceti]RFD20338.1 protein-glutamate O-methyltransferase CheR [Komagataeibacter melaceti]
MTGPGAFPPAGFRRLVNAVTMRTGLHYYVDKTDLLQQVVGARMRLHGCLTCHDYLALLSDDVRGDAEWRELESAITIGETFFFRYAEQFQALEHTILPRLIRRAEATRHLRVWSVGCSNGAEPYSIAIVLTRLLEEAGMTVADWHIEILGTDISTRALEQARRAEFSAWTLRDIPPGQRQEWFVPAGGRAWRLHERYRRMVSFSYGNILDLLRPDGGPAGPFDLILCRNVLIYFAQAQAVGLVRAMADRLAPEGWLLQGHSEPVSDFSPFLDTVRLPGTLAFCAPRSGPRQDVARQPVLAGPPAAPRRAPVPALPPAPVVDSTTIATEIRRVADSGHVRRGMEMCRDYLARHPVDARIHFLFAVLAWGEGSLLQAEESFRRVIYLCRDHVMARCYLSRMLEESGGWAQARRLRQQMVDLVRRCPPDMVLPDGDGLTAGGLLRLVRQIGDAPAIRAARISS